MAVVFDLLRAIAEYLLLIPDKEWDLLGAHFGSEKESLKGLIATLKMLQHLPCGAKRPVAYDPT